MSGFIKIDRKLFNHFLWNTDEPFTKAMAWIDLIQLAYFKDTRTSHKGKVVDRKRGTVYVSVIWLSERWRWSRGKTIRFLKLLEDEKMISQNGTTDGTTITIENYDIYQDGGTTSSTTDSTTDGTSAVQQTVHIRNKETNDNKRNNKYIYIVEQIIGYLNEKTGRHYKPSTWSSLITGKLNGEYTPEDFYKVIDTKCEDWLGTAYEQYLRPQTLFSDRHFEDYLNAPPRKKKTDNEFLALLEEMT